jgi:hypothetical protein
MSTRGVIGRTVGGEGEFSGVYNHSDSYPTWMGPYLWKMLHEQYRGNLVRMLKAVVGKPKRAHRITHKDIHDWIGIEWCWIFDEKTKRLFVRDHRNDADVAIIDLFGPEPDWSVIQCGETLERCSHYAYVHFPELKDTKSGMLGTSTYLGKSDFSFHDVAAVIIKGRRYNCTGSGHSHEGYWFSTVVAQNGKRRDLPVAVQESGNTYHPYPGVMWVFPPTKVNPQETSTQQPLTY